MFYIILLKKTEYYLWHLSLYPSVTFSQMEDLMTLVKNTYFIENFNEKLCLNITVYLTLIIFTMIFLKHL